MNISEKFLLYTNELNRDFYLVRKEIYDLLEWDYSTLFLHDIIENNILENNTTYHVVYSGSKVHGGVTHKYSEFSSYNNFDATFIGYKKIDESDIINFNMRDGYEYLFWFGINIDNKLKVYFRNYILSKEIIDSLFKLEPFTEYEINKLIKYYHEVMKTSIVVENINNIMFE